MTNSECEGVTSPIGGPELSGPEVQVELADLSDIILEIRAEAGRTNRLYERTLGLAVVPMLLRRAAGSLWQRWKHRRRSAR